MNTEADYQARLLNLPCWRGEVTCSRLLGGFSTVTFKIKDEGGVYVARCGGDVPIHNVIRSVEHRVSTVAASLAIGPRVHFYDRDVLILDFIEGPVFSTADVRRSAKELGLLLARIHAEMPGAVGDIPHTFDVFQTNRRYFAALDEVSDLSIVELGTYRDLLDSLEGAQISLPRVFAHHDLLPANIIEEAGRLWMIDWEYGAYGSPLFDLANLSSNSDFSVEHDRILLQAYFKEQPSETLIRSFSAMKVASLLREVLWGRVSKVYVQNAEVDYDAHCLEYMKRLEGAVDNLRNR